VPAQCEHGVPKNSKHHCPSASSYESTGGVIPPDGKKQSLDPALNGGRFVSSDGSASFDFYTTAAHDQPITEHMKSFAFGDGDEITSVAGVTDLDSYFWVQGRPVVLS
jgi:hypothetical protein